LHRILNDLLDISRIESGKAQMDFRKISPHPMVLEALGPFQTDFKDRGVTLSTELPNDLPEVWADTSRMNHVFANLLSNALRYTPSGEKRLSWQEQTRNGPLLRFRYRKRYSGPVSLKGL